MSPMTRPVRRAWLTAHVVTSVGWLGGAWCMVVLGTTGLTTADAPLRLASFELMHLFDRAVHIPLGGSMLVSGLVVSLRTPWGLVAHRWVLTKFVVSVVVLTATPVLAVPRQLDVIARLRAGLDPGAAPLAAVATGSAVVLILTALTAVSVVKPWGRTRWGQRPERR